MAGGFSQRDSGQDHSADNEALVAARRLRSRDAGVIRLSESDKLRLADAALAATAASEATKRSDPVADAQRMAEIQRASMQAAEVAQVTVPDRPPRVQGNVDSSRRVQRPGGERVMMKPGSAQHAELQQMVALGGDDKPATDSGDWTQQYKGRPTAETSKTPPAEKSLGQKVLDRLPAWMKPKKTE